MSKPLPPDDSDFDTLSSADSSATGITSRPRWDWRWFAGIIALAALMYIAGARSQMRTTRPELVGPFVGGSRSPDAASLLIHVSGAVANPGVYPCPSNARVQDAITKAGGPNQDANLDGINMAAFLEDGQKIEVPTKPVAVVSNVPIPTPALSSAPIAPTPTQNPLQSSAASPPLTTPLNLNAATQEQLELLPDIGPEMAKRIIAAREARGGFRSVEELDDIKDIGEKTMQQLRPLVTVN